MPFFVITVVHEGISPEDAERLLVMPLEIELRQVEGIEEINSFAAETRALLWWNSMPILISTKPCWTLVRR